MKSLPRTLSAAESLANEFDAGRLLHRRVEITVEREILEVINQPGTRFTALCPLCCRDVLLLSADAAALSTNTSPREIYRWLESGGLHFQELPTGRVFICSESLNTFERPPASGAARRDQIAPGEPK